MPLWPTPVAVPENWPAKMLVELSLARGTALLMTGRSIRDIASELGLTEGIVRQYLKATFKQTGTKRQADLIRVVVQRLMQDL